MELAFSGAYVVWGAYQTRFHGIRALSRFGAEVAIRQIVFPLVRLKPSSTCHVKFESNIALANARLAMPPMADTFLRQISIKRKGVPP